jgi:hypothetical protein
MFMRIPVILVCISAPFAFAQLDSNSVTVTASRNTALQADQAIFGVIVTSDVNTSLNDVVAAVQGAGITLANFSSVSGGPEVYSGWLAPVPPVPNPVLQWTFRLPVPLADTKDTVASLTSLQQSLQKNTALRLSFSVQGTQVSQQLVQSQTCSIPDLIADARAQAQKLAAAAGRGVGNILAMAGATSSSAGTAPAVCSVTVRFALGN